MKACLLLFSFVMALIIYAWMCCNYRLQKKKCEDGASDASVDCEQYMGNNAQNAKTWHFVISFIFFLIIYWFLCNTMNGGEGGNIFA